MTSLREVKQNICSSISLSLIIIDPKIVLRELLSLADLAKAQTLCIYKIIKVVIVNENENFILATFQVVAPSFKGFNNSQKLLVISFISSLNRNYLSGEKIY